MQRFKHGIYVERHGNTIGVDFMLKTVEVDGKKIKVISFFVLTYLQGLSGGGGGGGG